MGFEQISGFKNAAKSYNQLKRICKKPGGKSRRKME